MVCVVQQGDRIKLALVHIMAALDQQHQTGDEQAEQDDDGVDRQLRHDHGRIDACHDENREIFVEILHRD